MAVPTFVAASATPLAAASTTTIAPAIPVGSQADDIMLLVVETANEFVATPSGWALVDVVGSGGALNVATATTMFWKRHTGTESAPTLADPGDHIAGVIASFRGCETSGDPWNTKITMADAVSNTSFSALGVTTTVDECLIVVAGCVATDVATARFGAPINASLTSLAERYDQATTQGNGGGIGIFTGIKAVAGVVSNTTSAIGTASFKTGITVALKPPQAAAPVMPHRMLAPRIPA